MMKVVSKLAVIAFTIITIACLAGCNNGISKEEYNRISEELEKLKSIETDIEPDDSVSLNEYDGVVSELSDIKRENQNLKKLIRPRISEFPEFKAVVSGWESFNTLFNGTDSFFDTWIKANKIGTSFVPTDFLCFNESTGLFLWLALLNDDSDSDTRGFETVDFPGGLYVSAVAIDNDIKNLLEVEEYLKNWVNEQNNFELDIGSGRHRMTQVLTSDESTEALGYGQLEVLIPIKKKY